MITSTGNKTIRELVRLKKSAKERAKAGVFLVEGPKTFREIPRSLLSAVYASESFLNTKEGAAAKQLALSYGIGTEAVSDPVFQYLSDTKSPQGILAVVRQMKYEVEDLMGASPDSAAQKADAAHADSAMAGHAAALADNMSAGHTAAFAGSTMAGHAAPLIAVLENVQDPGNLGTILRSCEAAGASGILLSRGCADLYSPKVTRSTMGSIFRVPFAYAEHLSDAVTYLKKQGVRVLAAHLQGSVDLYEVSFTGPTAILIGNESRGLTDEMAALSSQAVRIPMSGSVESLNAAVAASVILFEAKRQRLRKH